MIVLPADSIAAMTGERPAGGGAGAAAGRWLRRRRRTTRRPSIAAASAPRASRRCRRSSQKGGTLVTFGQAGDLPIQRFGLPLRNIVAGLPSKEFWSPGSTLRVRFDNTNPIAYGMPAEGLALFMAGSQVYEVTSTDRSQDVEILATYVERDILQSGWLLGEQVIAKKAAAVVGQAWRRQGGADRLPPAASRPDARHVQAGVQRAAERSGRASAGVNSAAPQ